ncbi:MAG: hypothetical protein ACI4PR_02460 [Acutalibacteraceae bacterium]
MKIPFKMKTKECKVPATGDIAVMCKVIEEVAMKLDKSIDSVKKEDEKKYKKMAREAKDAAKDLDKFIVKMATKVNKNRDKNDKKDFLSRGVKPSELYGCIDDSDKQIYIKLYNKLSKKYGEIKGLVNKMWETHGDDDDIKQLFCYEGDFGECFNALNPNCE